MSDESNMVIRAVRWRAGLPYECLRGFPNHSSPALTLTPLSRSPPELISVASDPSLLRSGRSFVFAAFAGRTIRVSTMSARAGRGRDAGKLLAEFPLSDSSCLKIQKGDITEWFIDGASDAIVNPANERMLGGGGADGAIHDAAGRELREACYKVPEVRPGVRCPTGEARITPGFRLPAAYVIHTVGPIYDMDSNPEASLKSAYRNSLRVAKENNVQYIAFPAISCGVFRYPLAEAAAVSISTIKEFGGDLKEVHFVLYSDEIYNVWLEKAKQLLGN